MADLTPYRGQDVLKTSLSIRNAGDGLSKAMAIDPVELEPGETVMVVLECEVREHAHRRLDEVEGYELVQVLRAGTATLLDNDVVREAITEQADKNARHAEREKGTQRLPTSDELEAQHREGDHQDLVEGCPACDAERDAALSGN